MLATSGRLLQDGTQGYKGTWEQGGKKAQIDEQNLKDGAIWREVLRDGDTVFAWR